MKIPRPVKLFLSFLVSAGFLWLIYRRIDFQSLSQTLRNADPLWFWLYILLFVPQLIIAAARWKFILSDINHYPVSFLKSFQMVVGSYTANLVIPAKMGEVVRVFWVDRERSRYKPIIVVLFEKFWDLLAVYLLAYVTLFMVLNQHEGYSNIAAWASWINFLAVIVISGSLIIWFRRGFQPASKFSQRISALIVFILENRKKLWLTAGYSTVSWSVQLLQFYMMFRVFGVEISLPLAFAGGGLGVLAGAVIISIGGVGPRDAALIWFFSGIVSREILVSVGIISIFRIIVPALIGLPFFINLTFRRKAWKQSSGNT